MRNRNALDHSGNDDRPNDSSPNVGSGKRVQDVKSKIHNATSKTTKSRDNDASDNDRNRDETAKLQPIGNAPNAIPISENVNHGDKRLRLEVVQATSRHLRPRRSYANGDLNLRQNRSKTAPSSKPSPGRYCLTSSRR